jgi:hypothetical protein
VTVMPTEEGRADDKDVHPQAADWCESKGVDVDRGRGELLTQPGSKQPLRL